MKDQKEFTNICLFVSNNLICYYNVNEFVKQVKTN